MSMFRLGSVSGLAGCWVLLVCSLALANPSYDYQRALSYYGENKFASAKTLLGEAGAQRRDFKFYYLAGLVDLRLGEYEGALSNLIKAREEVSEDYPQHNLLYNLAFAHWKLGQHERAKQILQSLDSPLARRLMGYVTLERGISMIVHSGDGLTGNEQELATQLMASFERESQRLGFIDDAIAVDPPGFSTEELPANILLLPENQRYMWTIKSDQLTYILEYRGDNQPPQIISAHHSNTGKVPGEKIARGDQRTPTGVYFPVRKLTPERMPERYGSYAFPINYPNALDKIMGKTGYGIWLHGISEAKQELPYNSEGCIVFNNEGIFAVSRHIELHQTPVILSDTRQTVDAQRRGALRLQLLQALDAWEAGWESLDHERYMAAYSRDLSIDGRDYDQWSQYRRRVNGSKEYVDIALGDISLFWYPDLQDSREFALARFRQGYKSNNYSDVTEKLLYFVREDEAWKILAEDVLTTYE